MRLPNNLFPVLTNTPDDNQLAQAAALAGAQAFYTVDAQAGQQAWLDRLCAVSTQIGCIVYQNVIGPNSVAEVRRGQHDTRVLRSASWKWYRSRPLPSRGNAPMQVWRMQIQLSAPWPMQPEPITQFSALALVIQENGVWKFERFLTEEEIQASSYRRCSHEGYSLGGDPWSPGSFANTGAVCSGR